MTVTVEEWNTTPKALVLRGALVSASLLLAAAVSMSLDVRVATYFKHGDYPRWLAELFENAEPFGHGMGATFVVLAVLALDPARRTVVPWLFGGSLGAGAVANFAKLLIARSRPRNFDLVQGTVWDTFDGWLPRDSSGGIQSFPSAHTATAIGLALMLSTWYPRGRWLFFMLATLVGLHRIQSSAHFPSDVFAGAAVGWVVATLCLTMAERTTSRAEATSGTATQP